MRYRRYINKTLIEYCASGEDVLEECGESGEDASENADRILRNWEYGPTAAGRRSVFPILKNEVCISDVSEPDSSHIHCYQFN